MAANHWKNQTKFKVFSIWKKRKSKNAALNVLISCLARKLNFKVIQKWKNFVVYQDFILKEAKKNLNKFLKNSTFQKLKGFFLQEKIIRSFKVKLIFSNWKNGFLFRRKYWPLKLYQLNLKRKALTGFINKKLISIKKNKIKDWVELFRERNLYKIFFKNCVKSISLKKKYEFFILKKEIKRTKNVFRILLRNCMEQKLKSKKLKIADRFHKQKKMEAFKKKNNHLSHDIIIFKVFSLLKSNYIRKNAHKIIYQRFQSFRRRKILRKMLCLWLTKYEEKTLGKDKKVPNLYEFNLEKYQIQTPKFQIPHITQNFQNLMESSSNSNLSSHASWLKQYEENEKYMLNLLSEKNN